MNGGRIALITGATGYVGSCLTKKLISEHWVVHVIVRAESDLALLASVVDRVFLHPHDGTTDGLMRIMEVAKPDVVFHLASLFLAQHEPKDVGSLIASNVLFGNQLLEAMKVNEVTRIVNTGTSWQHYNNEDYNPVCLYAATKQAFEAILEYYIQACAIKAITLKLFDTYGPGDSRPKLFHLLNKAANSGEPLNMSAGEQLIDLVHIDDVVGAYLIAAQRLFEDKVSQHERYAVSSGHPLPLKELVQLHAKVTKRTIPVNWGARPYRHREVMTLWTNGLSLPHWHASTNLIDGLTHAFK